MDDKDDGVGVTAAIVSPSPLPLGIKFTITSMIVHVLTLKGLFSRVAGDDIN